MIFRTKYCRPLLYCLLLLILAQCSPQKKTEEKEPAVIETTTPEQNESVEVQTTTTITFESTAKDRKNPPTTGKKKNNNTYALYQQKIASFKFEAFPVKEKYSGKAAPLDLVSHEDARLYQKTLTRGLATGSNFAGKYTLVSVPCGDVCQDNYIIETQTGKITDKVQSSSGVSFRPDSRLLIVNPPALTTDYQVCQNCAPIIYILEKGLLYRGKLIK
ncbi:MAG: hypothetical protein ACO1OF_01430 [Adhaeribacter sp.]